MKTFLDLLATNFAVDIDMTVCPRHAALVEVIVNGKCIYNNEMKHATEFHYPVPLLTPIDISIFHHGVDVTSLEFDGWQARPQWGQDSMGVWRFSTGQLPFYQWKHHATAQGWLLQPTNTESRTTS